MRFCYSCMSKLEEDIEYEVCPYCGEPMEFTYDVNRFLPPGTILQEKFMVGRPIGNGGFGNTYIGWNETLQCKVAIKEYFPRPFSLRAKDGVTISVTDKKSQERYVVGLKRFLVEAKSIAGLQDVDGVVKVYSFFTENKSGYIVMEFLEGMDLKGILKQAGGRVEYEWARKVILTVLYTLREIHKKGVIHRDIAPDNVFITNTGVVKLIDFGAAKAAVNRSADKTIVLKHGYAPIEQYSKTAEQGPYTDLYAVSALFYRMLCGRKPQAANERVQNDQLKTLSEMGIHIPEQAEYGIMVCLNVDSKFRLQNADEFMELLGGKDFTPAEEPIDLPEEEQPVGAFGSFIKRFSAFPAWQKAAISIGSLSVLLVLIISMVLFLTPEKGEEHQVVSASDHVVEQCEGEPEEKAVKKLKQMNLDLDIKVEYKYYKPDLKEATVLNMSPAAGTAVERGDTVTLTVESPEKITLPDYTGKRKKEIKDDLITRLGESKVKELETKELFVYKYNSAAKDTCFSQSYKNTVVEIKKLDTVNISMSWGTKESYMVRMPNLVNKSMESARKLLKERGFRNTKLVDRERTYNAGVAKDAIIKQSITEGKQYLNNPADKNSQKLPKQVYVTISKGPEPTPEPTPKPTPRRTPQPEQRRTPKPTQAPRQVPKPAPTPKRIPKHDFRFL